jgi:murein DD-endopeptidase MepM/ murein hydrolase activator NlpD
VILSVALPAVGVAMTLPAAPARQPLAESAEYVVRGGDTLTSIAQRYGVSLNSLMQVNGLANPDRIYVGQRLVIPAANPASGEVVHIVQAGDSLGAIALRYGSTVDELARLNNIANPSRIAVGQRVVIVPAVAAVPAAPGVVPAEPAPVEQAAPPLSDLEYILRRGESLYHVSLRFGVSVEELVAANGLISASAVYPGLAIRIPEASRGPGDLPSAAPGSPQTGGRTYRVAPGDTLSAIAIRYDVTVDGLIAANGLTSIDSLYVGQVLNIPEAGATARPYPVEGATIHTVQPGETLSAIALRYGVSATTLAIANGFSSAARIFPGMVLSIPSAQAGSNSVAYASVGEGICEGVEEITRTGTGYFTKATQSYVITQGFHSWHPGIDLADELGTSIFAADGGTVVFSGWNSAGYGNLIVLDHGNGWRTYYAHLRTIYVACEAYIPRGAIIAEMGSTGNSTGPHLHFELLRFGVPVDPTGYIRF